MWKVLPLMADGHVWKRTVSKLGVFLAGRDRIFVVEKMFFSF
jgi:hypothetical protein